MVISSFGIACRPHFCLRAPPFHCISKVQVNLVAAMEALDEPEGLFKNNKSSNSANGRKDAKAPAWKKLNSTELGITTSMIDKPTRKVLNGLKRKGYEVYLVGGCVRDLILNRTPKDFDIITSAELKEVQTVIPASTSFREDCACILRAIRIAARLGFCISKETVHSVNSLSYSILRLDKGRLLMEMNYMLAYGYAEASLRLLWKFRLLELLLPIQAAYFVCHGFRRRDKRTNMLLSLFSNLDKLLLPDKPCHSSLWVAILAFHNALSEQPRDPLVVAALSLAIHNGGDMLEAVSIAKRVTKVHAVGFHELLESQNLNPRALRDEVKNLAASLTRALNNMTDEQIVSQAMAGYPQAPDSDLVLIPWGLSLRVCRIFSCLTSGAEMGFIPRQGSKIDYESLAQGALPEVRHIFAGVVFDTIYPLSLNRDNSQT